MESKFITASDGVKIHYLQAGESGSWVVLQHGFTDSATRMWGDSGIIAALADRHRVVAVDARNHGKSDKPTPGAPGNPNDTLEVMRHLGIERAHIHGYSMGGAFTQNILSRHPELFITAGFHGSGIMESDEARRAAAAELDPKAPEPTAEQAAALEARRARREAAVSGGARPRLPRNRQPTTIDLTKIKIPVICINGEFDRPYSKSQRMWRELDVFQNVVLAGRNHLNAVATNGFPPEYTRALVGFINTYDE